MKCDFCGEETGDDIGMCMKCFDEATPFIDIIMNLTPPDEEDECTNS